MTEPSSPVCYGGDGDPAYMGHLSNEELVSFLNRMLEAERAGARVALRTVQDAQTPQIRALARAIQRDEARWCAMLRQAIRILGGVPSSATGAFYEKAAAISDVPARLEFLNKGQAWVVKRLREALPKIGDDGLHRRLKAMLVAHEISIQKVAASSAPER